MYFFVLMSLILVTSSDLIQNKYQTGSYLFIIELDRRNSYSNIFFLHFLLLEISSDFLTFHSPTFFKRLNETSIDALCFPESFIVYCSSLNFLIFFYSQYLRCPARKGIIKIMLLTNKIIQLFSLNVNILKQTETYM